MLHLVGFFCMNFTVLKIGKCFKEQTALPLRKSVIYCVYVTCHCGNDGTNPADEPL
jgi:hypothetical protein